MLELVVYLIVNEDRIGCSSPQTCKEICGNEASCTDIAYPLIVIELIPRGLRGLMLACMIAALMTSLTSIFNSSSTIFTIDIWQRFRARALQLELLIVGSDWFNLFAWEYSYSVPPYALSHTDQRPDAIKFHYLYFAILLFVLTCLITITISLLTRPIPDQCLHGLNIFDLNNPV
ncbi:unnamed protein product [Rotaria socialis]|uniref:Uncharacterized protein n=2 Tax=Rotaria TaxID=231623 RepID=A0A818XVV2_9BILA|nr:unnamed protein product [Rotaria magnacalcarata]CAF3031250.1 unnamed protein product [Rotaria socialis]CAF3328968.1 unnamed protein product [Rotaria socialis]CAF3742907.1 unnamed protein product [Rotaria socialis]CAF4238093.1 unnamed protein product [Rotaria socialis]